MLLHQCPDGGAGIKAAFVCYLGRKAVGSAKQLHCMATADRARVGAVQPIQDYSGGGRVITFTESKETRADIVRRCFVRVEGGQRIHDEMLVAWLVMTSQ